MKYIKYIVYIFVITCQLIIAQKELTLEQVSLNPESLSPKKLAQLQWIADTDNFSYVFKENTETVLFSESIGQGNRKELTTLSDINRSLRAAELDSMKSFPTFSWFNETEIWFWNKNKLVKFNIATNAVEVLNEIHEKGKNQEFNHYKKIAYTVDNNLFISDNFNQIQITKDEDNEIVNGQAVHRNEFGINKGIFWSPNENYLAYYRMDESMVTDYPVIDYTLRPAENKSIKYPMAGMESHQVKIGVYNLKTGQTIFLQTGEPADQYLPGVTWSPDEKYIFVNQLNREQKHLKVTKYDAATGKMIKVLFEEKNEKYVEPMQGLFFYKNEPDIFIWLSRNEGWNHLYLYDSAGNRIKKLTNGEWEVTSFDGFDEKGFHIYYTSTEENPLERHCYRLNLNSYESTRITNQPGTHKLIRNKTSDFYLDEFNSLTVPYKVNLLDRNGEIVREIYSSPDPLEEYQKD
jgi:dipeptidyl-peptidase 4